MLLLGEQTSVVWCYGRSGRCWLHFRRRMGLLRVLLRGHRRSTLPSESGRLPLKPLSKGFHA